MIEKIYQKKIFFPLLLVIISFILFITNYKSGTFLVGWDNLFPELNFSKAIKVNLFGVWQWYRGLGSQDGLAHAATLPHTAFIFILSKILPVNTLRYVFQILMHLLGGVGMYYLIKKYKKNDYLAFIGALFYEFNLATIQMFYAPLEVFSVHFAALPWLVYSILPLYERVSKSGIIAFFFLNLITTTQGFVPTVFIAYLFAVLSIILVLLIKHGKSSLKTSFLILAVIFVTNAFWLLPFVHSALTQGKIIKNAKINQLSSDSIYERNKRRGGVLDLLYLKGFMLDTTEDNLEGRQDFIMKDWNNHINNPYIFTLLSAFALLFILGVVKIALRTFKHKYFSFETYFLPLLFICWLTLGTRVPIFSYINNIMRDIFPLFAEAFRFPITKFFIVYAFVFTLFFISGLEFMIEYKPKHKNKIFLVFVILIMIYTLPSFKGHFFYNALRLKIPQEYFETINFFKKENKSGRIMTLPQATFWNWKFYTWGARGSGFLWYGIEQAMLERPFDPWNNFNEQYYNEVFYALQTENENLFKNVVEKYDISFILIDGFRAVESKVQQIDKLELFVKRVFPGTFVTRFGKITIFSLIQKNPTALHTNNLKQASTFYYDYKDSIYEKNGNYITSGNWDTMYLFPSLFTNRTQEDIEFSFEQLKNNIVIRPNKKLNINENTNSLNFRADPYPKDETLVPVRIKIEDNNIIVRPIGINIILDDIEQELLPFDQTSFQISRLKNQSFSEIRLNGNIIVASDEASFGLAYAHLKNTLFIATDSNLGISYDFILQNIGNNLSFLVPVDSSSINYKIQYPILRPVNWRVNNILENKNYLVEAPCPDDIQPGLSLYEEASEGITLKSQNSSTCLHQYLERIPQNLGVYFNISAKNLSGSPLYFVIDNPQQDVNVVDTILHPTSSKNIVIVPPTSKYFYTDYGSHFRNTSSGSELAINKISWMNVGYLPYSWIKTFRFEKNINVANIEKYFYLSQSYNPSWLAYKIKNDPNNLKMLIRIALPFLYGTRLKEHVLVNNWANGWALRQGSAPQGTEVVVIFWPQYLQFLGFFFLLITFLYIFRVKEG